MISRPLALVFGLVAHAAGCTATEGDPAVVSPPDGPAIVLPPGGPAVEPTAQGTAFAQKTRFVIAAKADLAELEAGLARLDTRAGQSAGASKIEGEVRLEGLRERLTRTEERLEAVAVATEANWEETRGAFEKSRKELDASFERAREWMKEEMGP